MNVTMLAAMQTPPPMSRKVRIPPSSAWAMLKYSINNPHISMKIPHIASKTLPGLIIGLDVRGI